MLHGYPFSLDVAALYTSVPPQEAIATVTNKTSKETIAQVVHHKHCKNAPKSTSHCQPLYLLKLLVIESKTSVRKDRMQYHKDVLSRYVVVLKLVFC